MYNMPVEERTEMGRLGREHVMTNYGFENFNKSWDKIITEVHEKNGSWSNRKNYNAWSVEEL